MSRKKRSYVRAKRVTKSYMYHRGPQKSYRKGSYSIVKNKRYYQRMGSSAFGT